MREMEVDRGRERIWRNRKANRKGGERTHNRAIFPLTNYKYDKTSREGIGTHKTSNRDWESMTGTRTWGLERGTGT